jgi:hypothetical protein
METINSIVLFGIFIASIANLAVEVDETKDTKYILIAKSLFCLMAIGSIFAVVRPQVGFYLLLNSAVFAGLVIRIIRSINRNK